MLYKFIDEGRIKACPKNGVANGRAISNLPRYFEKNPEIALSEGYKPLITQVKPEYDSETQYLTPVYEETETQIIQSFEVNEIPQEADESNA